MLSLTAKGLTTGEIAANFDNLRRRRPPKTPSPRSPTMYRGNDRRMQPAAGVGNGTVGGSQTTLVVSSDRSTR